jgi:uncharacterized protein YcnI
MNKNTLPFAGTAVAAGAVLALAAPLAALAHVTIGTDQADPGSYPVIDFRVPTESATASTTRIDITLPLDTPFGHVATVPVAGWTARLVTEKLPSPLDTDDGSVTDAVSHVIWTAEPGHEITPEQYGIFPVLLGNVPDTGRIVLPVEQTYSDGTVVEWSQTGEGAENPAPVLYVTDEPPAGHHDDDAGPSVEVQGDAPRDDVVARGLGVAGLVVGAVGLVVAILRRRSAA